MDGVVRRKVGSAAPSTRIDAAREAFNNHSIEKTKAAHSAEQFAHKEEHQTEHGKYIKDVIYGGIDGIITTFAIVSGVAGARLASAVVLILGLANLVADGFSMGVGNYLGTKAEIEFARKERQREEYEVDNYPEGEIQEIREIYAKKGFKGEELETVVRVITSDKKIWVDTMMVEELGILLEEKSPIKAAVVTFISFFSIGMVPLSAYILAAFYPSLLPNAFTYAIVLTGLTIFMMGVLKSRITGLNWLRSGIETLAIGSAAAFVAYYIGFLLREFQFES